MNFFCLWLLLNLGGIRATLKIQVPITTSEQVNPNSATTTTTGGNSGTGRTGTIIVKHVGRERTPILILDNVLPERAYISLREDLRRRTDFVEGDGNNNKIATLDWAIVGPLLDAMLGNKQLTDIYPRVIFEQREHVRGYASILCNPGWVHNIHMSSDHKDTVAPAAVFYFAFDGVANAPAGLTKKTGTAFYREKESGLERMTKLGGNAIEFCARHPRSLGCSHRVKEGVDMGADMGTSNKNKGSKNNPQDASAFEETYRVVGEPNRLVLYPQDVLHKAWIEDPSERALETKAAASTSAALPCSPKDGRLAISLFFLSQNGREIVNVLEGAWRTEVTEQLQSLVPAAAATFGGGGATFGSGGGLEVVGMEETINPSGRRLNACGAFKMGVDWNNVPYSTCSLSETTVLDGGDQLRVRGSNLYRSELARGGSPLGNRAPYTTAKNNHFVVKGASKLTLKNLKLSGGWSGIGQCNNAYCYQSSKSSGSIGADCSRCCGGTCGACYSVATCDETYKGGSLRIESASSTVLLVDIIFASNKGYQDNNNIYSAVPVVATKLFLMNMPIPTDSYDNNSVALVSKTVCDSNANSYCTEFYESTCVVDSSIPTTARVLCSCANGMYGNFSSLGGSTTRPTTSVCFPCLEGKWSGVYLENANGCTLCSAGKYNKETGRSTACLDCNKGYYVDEAGSSTCLSCLPGNYQSQKGQTNCNDICIAGQYSLVGSSFCTKCLVGEYSLEIGASKESACVKCKEGQYINQEGSISCKMCPKGYFNNETGSYSLSFCKACQQGTYNVEEGATSVTSCQKCVPGKYSNGLAASKASNCILCNPSTYSDGNGNYECSLCDAGKANDQRGSSLASDCKLCEPGYYNSELGNTCIPCSNGKFSSKYGAKQASVCTDCSKGTYAMLQKGSPNCSLCPPGYWSDKIEASFSNTCKECLPGTYNSESGAVAISSCLPCPTGTYMYSAGLDSLSKCISCDVGKYGTEEGATSLLACIACVKGQYNEKIGASSETVCKTCRFGKISTKKLDDCTFTGSGMVTGICIGVGVIALIVLGFFCKRRMNNLNEDHGTRMNEMIDLHSKDIEHVLNPLEQSQFTVDPSELHLGKIIGQGGCGFIYKATLGANTIVAAKEIITVAIDPEDIAEFEHEARMLTQMNHPNVLRVLGFCKKPAEQCEDNQEHKYIITEFAPNGSLENIIIEAEKKAKQFKEAGVKIHEASMPFTKIQALEWALQTASGMLYLHSRGFMHRDMKPQNILLNKSKDALVADLGTVRLAAQKDRTHAVGEKQRQMQLDAKLNLFDDRQQGKVNINETKQYVNATGMTTMLGTPAYMAPEQTWSEDYTFPVDVWAFGCTLVRLFTLKDPYDTEYNVRTIIMSVAHGDLRPVEVQIEDVPHPDVRNVINECLQFQGNKRLTFNAIEDRLKIALDECIENSKTTKKERRRIKDLKKQKRIKRREDEAREKAKNANDAKKPENERDHQELRALLKQHNLGRHYDTLVAEGLRSKEDLAYVTVNDLREWGLGRIEARKAVAAFSKIPDQQMIDLKETMNTPHVIQINDNI